MQARTRAKADSEATAARERRRGSVQRGGQALVRVTLRPARPHARTPTPTPARARADGGIIARRSWVPGYGLSKSVPAGRRVLGGQVPGRDATAEPQADSERARISASAAEGGRAGGGGASSSPSLPRIAEEIDDVPLEDCWYARPQLFFQSHLRPTGGRQPKNPSYKIGLWPWKATPGGV